VHPENSEHEFRVDIKIGCETRKLGFGVLLVLEFIPGNLNIIITALVLE
jgi:hypothetical protein